MKSSLLALCLLLPLAIAGCSTDGDAPPRQCPQVAIVRELERIEDYGTDAASILAAGKMQNVKGECAYKSSGVDVNFELTLLGARSARLNRDRVSFPFFISIVDPDRRIVAKESMTANFAFGKDEKTKTRVEPLHVFIPLPKNANAANYQVLTGFQLTQEQLEKVRGSRNEVRGKGERLQ